MDEPTSTAGDVLAGRYELIESIGRGGFGVVFRARQLNMDREVAIKMLPAAFMTLPDIVDRFKREAKLTSRLSHPNTITVHDYGQHGNELFIVMELLRGEDLADLLKTEHTLPPERIVSIASQILKSLAEAHSHNIIHRDLKPENIFICDADYEEDIVKVLDFGIAKLTTLDTTRTSQRQITVTGSTVGTPVYMSPEQAAGEQVTPATDLYALGVLMYEMACGRPPFQFDNPVKTMRAHLFDEVPALTNPALRGTHLERVILRALAKEPRLRHADAREFLDDLMGRGGKATIVPVDLEGLSDADASAEMIDAFEKAQTTELDDESEGELLGNVLSDIARSKPSRNVTASYSNAAQSTPLYQSAQRGMRSEDDVPTRREEYRTPTGSSTSSILRIVALPAHEQPDDSDVIVLTKTKREGTKLEHSVREISIIDEDEDALEPGLPPSPPRPEPAQGGDWSFGDIGASREAVRLIESGAHPVVGYEPSDGDEDSSRNATYVLLALFVIGAIGCAAFAWSQGLLF